MNKIVAALLVFGTVAVAFAGVSFCRRGAQSTQIPANVEFAFQKWMSEHNKKYATPAELNYRRTNFLANFLNVQRVNSDPTSTWTAGLNVFSDLTHQELVSGYTGLLPEAVKQHEEKIALQAPAQENNLGQMPSSVDWTTVANIVNPIKNQGQCGSCWAFSATATTESANAIYLKKNAPDLSEQQLVSCSSAQGNQGCNGGWPDWAFKYVISYTGQDTESSYPYKAITGVCNAKLANIAGTVSTFTDVSANSCSSMMAAVVKQPVSVAIYVNSNFQAYKSGVYSDTTCNSQSVNHAVNVVGYNNAGTAYWKVRNSWGASWGMNGYINMAQNVGGAAGMCRICTVVSYSIPKTN